MISKENLGIPKNNKILQNASVNDNAPKLQSKLKNIPMTYKNNLLKDIITRDVDAPVGLYKKNLIPGDVIDVEGIEGEIIGTKNMEKGNIGLSNEKGDLQSPDINIHGGSININAPKIGLNEKHDDKKVTGKISGVIIPQKEEEIKGRIPGVTSEVEVHAPKVDINAHKVDINAPKVDINAPKVEVKGDIKAPKVDINAPKVEVKGDIKAPKVSRY